NSRRPYGPPKALTVQQLLWIETILKLSGGLVLLTMPRVAVKVLGLPAGDSSFWPRLLGAVLIGMAGGFYIEGARADSKGLALAAAILVSLAAAGTVAAQLVIMRSAPTQRGAAVLWLLVALLFFLSLLEIASI